MAHSNEAQRCKLNQTGVLALPREDSGKHFVKRESVPVHKVLCGNFHVNAKRRKLHQKDLVPFVLNRPNGRRYVCCILQISILILVRIRNTPFCPSVTRPSCGLSQGVPGYTTHPGLVAVLFQYLLSDTRAAWVDLFHFCRLTHARADLRESSILYFQDPVGHSFFCSFEISDTFHSTKLGKNFAFHRMILVWGIHSFGCQWLGYFIH